MRNKTICLCELIANKENKKGVRYMNFDIVEQSEGCFYVIKSDCKQYLHNDNNLFGLAVLGNSSAWYKTLNDCIDAVDDFYQSIVNVNDTDFEFNLGEEYKILRSEHPDFSKGDIITFVKFEDKQAVLKDNVIYIKPEITVSINKSR